MKIQDAILVLTVLGIMTLCFFIVARLDSFSGDEQKRNKSRRSKEKQETYLLLSSKLTDDELIGRIREYEEAHDDTKIAVFENYDDICEEIFYERR